MKWLVGFVTMSLPLIKKMQKTIKLVKSFQLVMFQWVLNPLPLVPRATRPTISQFSRLTIGRLASFIWFSNVVQRIMKLQSCERVGRVLSVPLPSYGIFCVLWGTNSFALQVKV